MDDERSELRGRLDDIRARYARERGERLKEERRRLGYTKIEFASLLGIHRNTQGNYESGREPPTDYLVAAQGVGVDVAYVMDGGRQEGFPENCFRIVEIIFKKASSLGLSHLAPEALAYLAYLLAISEKHAASELPGGMDSEQVDALVEAAFRTPEEFSEAVSAVATYRHLATGADPTPMEDAASVLSTLSAYEQQRDKLHLGLRDNIRLVAEAVIRSRGNGAQ